MARNRFAITFRTSGRRAQGQTGLVDAAGNILKRNDQARKLASASTSRKAVSITSKAIRTTYNIAADQLTGKLKASTTVETIRVFASQRRFYLSQFGARWNGRGSSGVQATIVVGRAQTYVGAFMAPGRANGKPTKLVYTRAKEKTLQTYGRYKGKFRQSIIANRGPSPYEMVVDPAVGSIRNPVLRELSQYFLIEYRRHFRNKNGN